MHTEVCIGLDIAHFPSLMYGFIMQQIVVTLLSYLAMWMSISTQFLMDIVMKEACNIQLARFVLAWSQCLH